MNSVPNKLNGHGRNDILVDDGTAYGGDEKKGSRTEEEEGSSMEYVAQCHWDIV